MRISCITRASEIGAHAPDLIVLPEYTDRTVVQQLGRTYPESVVVTAVELDGRSCGRLIFQRRNWIDYKKIDTDGRTTGTGIFPKSAVCHFPHMSVGVVICIDIQNLIFVNDVIRQLRSSEAQHKFLCIPADMGSEWFGSDTLLGDFEGVHVAMSNRTHYSPPIKRLQSASFITDIHGRKVVKRATTETIQLRLD
jgi:predicted amidohydrolase